MKKVALMLVVVVMVVRAITQAPAQAQDPVEIKFVHIFSDQQDFRSEVVLQIAQEFMAQNPNVTVTVEAPTSDYEELFNSALLAAEQGNAPHVVQVEESLTQLAVDSQLFVPISQVASEEQLADLEDYLPQVKAFFSVGEELWGLPWNTSTPLLYYNKNLFEAAGLDPNAPPTTFDEVLATCAAFQAAQLEGLDACMNWPLASWFPEQWMAMQNAVLVNNDNGRSARASEVLFTAPEMLNVLTWWQTMSDNDYYTYSGTPNDYNGDAIIFLGQSTAMHINSTAGVTLLKSFSAAQGFELGIAPLPLPSPEATNGLTVGGASLFISAGYSEAETQAAIDFAFFLTNTQNGATWHQGTGYFPNRQSTLDLLNEEGWFEANPDFAIGLQQVLDGQQNVATAGMVLGPAQQVRGFLIEAIQSVVDQGADPLEALEAAKGRADQALADYNALFE